MDKPNSGAETRGIANRRARKAGAWSAAARLRQECSQLRPAYAEGYGRARQGCVGQAGEVPQRTSALWAVSFSFALAVALAALPALSAGPSAAETPSRDAAGNIHTEALDRAISETLSRPEYSWRLPRERVERPAGPMGAFLSTLADKIKEWLRGFGRFVEKIIDWLDKHIRLKESDTTTDMTRWQVSAQTLLFTLLAITASVLALVLFRMWKRRKMRPPIAATALAVAPDIAEESVSADQLPSDEWIKLAADLLDKGELRLAIRAMFFSCLANLAQREKIVIAKHKSNREYMLELERRAHNQPPLLAAFAGNVGIVERVWYGAHPANRDLVALFAENTRAIAGVESIEKTAAQASAGGT